MATSPQFSGSHGPRKLGRTEMEATLPPHFSSALFYAGPVFSVGLQLSNAQVAWKILSNKSVGSLSPLPFASLFANCLIWMYYGFLIRDAVVYLPNMIGATIGMFCIFAYESMSNASNIIVYTLVAITTLLATGFAYLEDAETLGYLGVGLAGLVTVAPLATLGTVMKERSTAAMPLIPSIMAFCNALSWTLYGLLVAKDFMIYGPSLGGVFFSLIQLGIFLVYGLPSKAPGPTKMSSIEPV